MCSRHSLDNRLVLPDKEENRLPSIVLLNLCPYFTPREYLSIILLNKLLLKVFPKAVSTSRSTSCDTVFTKDRVKLIACKQIIGKYRIFELFSMRSRLREV